MTYSKDAYEGGRIFLTAEQKQAVDEGKKFAQRAYADVWARDAGLVQRVRTFLGDNFHWHGRLSQRGTDLEVIQTLQSMIRGESVVLVAEKPRSGGAGNTGLLASIGSAFVAYDDGETREQMRAFARSILYPPGEPVLSGSYDPATQQAKLIAARASIATIGGAFDDAADASTLLGDAQPFEYGEDMPAGDDIELAGSEGTPRNNQAQNAQFKAVVRALGLDPSQARQLHDEISKQGLGYHEILERGQDMFGGGDD
ncbi:hypothetical protein LMG28614_03242 [Paraburkholderia ultramafica]|uniref:Uncharacterized protein n=2 Tax=Paraburkholderia ultramafica TaxID=1544867 RepID=A0A6S7B8C3_9BURK|nr:hypothetical protein LMG28614_03242 [Paraburkholderia ultramafica]